MPACEFNGCAAHRCRLLLETSNSVYLELRVLPILELVEEVNTLPPVLCILLQTDAA